MKVFKTLMALSLAALAAGCAPTLTPLESTSVDAGTFNNVNGKVTADLGLPTINAGSMVNAAGQKITFTFLKPVDQSTVASALFFYPMTTSTNTPVPVVYGRGSALSYTSEVVGNDLVITLDASNASDPLEVEILADKLTGANGSAKMDPNSNQIYGESGEVYIDYITGIGTSIGGSAPSVPTAGTTRNPTATLNPNFGAALLSGNSVQDIALYTGTNVFSFTVPDLGSENGDLITTTGAGKVYKFTNDTWQELSGVSTNYNQGTQTATVTLPVGEPVANTTYKVVVNKYLILESQAVLGYVHRASYDEKNKTGNRDEVAIVHFNGNGTTTAGVDTPTVGGSSGARYITLTSSTYPFDLATISANENLRIKVDAGQATYVNGTSLAVDANLPFTVQVMETYSDASYNLNNAVSTIRLMLPSNIANITSGEILIAPTVLTPTSSTANLSKLSFGDVNGNDGWRVASF